MHSKQCKSCPWKFQCPSEQLWRVECRACESKKKAAREARVVKAEEEA